MAEAGKSAGLSLPPLSSTYQSSYLWAPHHLSRLTINQRRYHSYVSKTLESTPPHLNVLQRRVQKYGSDSHFHCHRDIPEHQNYSLTALKLSNLRPADQLVDRPMSKDSRVIEKEVGLPYPAEHPYTSHISQFSVFPDTQTTPTHSQSHTHRNVGTQITTSDPYYQSLATTPFLVTQKAFEKGLRIEKQHQLSHMTDHVIKVDGCGQLWSSTPHQRSKTYPAPKVMYQSSSSLQISPPTQNALNDIHTLVAGTTSYNNHFGHTYGNHAGPNRTTSGQTMTTGGGRRLFSSFSHSRPYTVENRSKYRGSIAIEVDKEEDEDEEEEEGERVKRDVATQTEPDVQFPTIGTNNVPHSEQTETTHKPKPAIAAQTKQLRDQNMHQRSFSVNESLLYRPRSSVTCCRFSELFVFNRSDVMKKFHSQYLEPVPDLRQYGIQSGRRHTIHGYNSYYFH